MSEKSKLLDTLIEKTEKSKEELELLVSEKINELSGLVSEEGAIYIIANELGVRIENEKPKSDSVDFQKINEITQEKLPVSLVAKVIRKYDKVNFSSENSEGSVQSLLVGDETGIIRITFWHEKTEILENIQENDIVKINNAYTRENNQTKGRIEIHYSQYSDIEVNPEGVQIITKEFKPEMNFTQKKVSEIEDGERNIQLSGIVTSFEIPRFYLGCPECFKKVLQDEDNYKCAQHDDVEALKIPIVNLTIDDGSGTINVVGFRNRAEDITKFSSEQIIALTQDINKYNDFSHRIIGSKIKLGGNVGSNSITGEKQVLANMVHEIELKEVSQITKDLVDEDNKKKADSKLSDEINDDLDIDIEEIDMDDDLL